MTRTRASRRLATAFAVVPVLAACSSGGDGCAPPPARTPPP
jgi:hypothetical protein